MTHPAPDPLREARSRVSSLLRMAGYPNAADYVSSDYMLSEMRRVALAAAPQPAPVPADERAAMAEAMADASESCCYMSDIYRMTDALLVKGFGLRGGAEAGLREALEKLHHAVCGETGFAAAVRQESGKAYPWPALDIADELARAALAAAPQPAPAPADERAAMIEVIVQADDAYDRVQGGTWAGAIADALLAAGYRKADALLAERDALIHDIERAKESESALLTELEQARGIAR